MYIVAAKKKWADKCQHTLGNVLAPGFIIIMRTDARTVASNFAYYCVSVPSSSNETLEGSVCTKCTNNHEDNNAVLRLEEPP
jgi:hypothetical protein